MYRLLFLSGPLKGKRLVIRHGDVEIGHDPSCAIQVPDDAMAGRHLALTQEPKGVFLRRLALTYPVKVNGADIRETRLEHGDEIDVGQTRILFQLVQTNPMGERRRLGKTYRLASFSVALLLAAQTTILIGLFVYWRMDPLNQIDFEEEQEAVTEDKESPGPFAEEEQAIMDAMQSRLDATQKPRTSSNNARVQAMQRAVLPLRFDMPRADLRRYALLMKLARPMGFWPIYSNSKSVFSASDGSNAGLLSTNRSPSATNDDTTSSK